MYPPWIGETTVVEYNMKEDEKGFTHGLEAGSERKRINSQLGVV